MSWAGEGCRALTSPVPLIGSQAHCPYCSGYGATQAPRNDPSCTYFNPIPCWQCGGTGLSEKAK